MVLRLVHVCTCDSSSYFSANVAIVSRLHGGMCRDEKIFLNFRSSVVEPRSVLFDFLVSYDVTDSFLNYREPLTCYERCGSPRISNKSDDVNVSKVHWYLTVGYLVVFFCS